MTKRIYNSRVKKWLVSIGAIGIPVAIGLFIYLSLMGSITITGFSHDNLCVGTVTQPCYVYINFTANENIFIYPNSNWTKTAFETDPQVKDIKMYRSWGNSWREIPLNKTCTGTWCGGTGKYKAKYSYAFRNGRNYQLKFEIIKNNPSQDINVIFKI